MQPAILSPAPGIGGLGIARRRRCQRRSPALDVGVTFAVAAGVEDGQAGPRRVAWRPKIEDSPVE